MARKLRIQYPGAIYHEDWEPEFLALERAWCFGGEAFRQDLLAQVHEVPGPSHFGEAVQEAVKPEPSA